MLALPFPDCHSHVKWSKNKCRSQITSSALHLHAYIDLPEAGKDQQCATLIPQSQGVMIARPYLKPQDACAR